jgi:c-di-AMP phosphodiesterase-like protein
LLDNHDELLNGMSPKEKSAILSDVDEKVNFWVGDSSGYLCKYDRDRYFFLFEERDYDAFISNNFSILAAVRSNIGAGGVHATLSIGVGKDGATPNENYRFASLGLEMALSRGGDQAVVRSKYGFEYFGGHSPQNEKRTKVKSRVMAGAFAELLEGVSTVYIMGHKYADFDSVGAAIGICCVARSKNKRARIIVDFENNFVRNIIDIFMKIPEYSGIFVTAHDAILEADSKSLLVVVDTSRPDKVESESMLLSCTCIAVIDHHRRAANYIDNAAFNYHVPFASSTSELVTEMLEYLVEKSDIMRPETEALLAGIVLDTKGFSINTGSRTFDAAAFLQRLGADMAAVKRLLQTDFETATARFAIMSGAMVYREGIAIASSERPQSRLSIPQAADDLLNIEGVHTSFAAAPSFEDVFVSGRSIGGVNVQVILEKLGGGGSRSSAGLQVHGMSVAQVVENLKEAIDEYLAS